MCVYVTQLVIAQHTISQYSHDDDYEYDDARLGRRTSSEQKYFNTHTPHTHVCEATRKGNSRSGYRDTRTLQRCSPYSQAAAPPPQNSTVREKRIRRGVVFLSL